MAQLNPSTQRAALRLAIEALQTVQSAPRQANNMTAAIRALKKLLAVPPDMPEHLLPSRMEGHGEFSSAGETDIAPSFAWGRMLRQRREGVGLTRVELARLAGISEGTIKSVETGRRLPTQAVLMHLLGVSELGLEAPGGHAAVPWHAVPDAGVDQGPALNCWLAPGFEPLKMLKDLVMQINGRGGHIEQSHLYLDHMSAACWCAIADQEDYARAQRDMPLERAAAQILESAGGAGLDVLGLGCGDGKNEVRLVQSLLERVEHGDLRLYLLDISQPLLGVAYKHAADSLADRRGVSMFAIQGNFHHLPRYTQLLYTPQRAHRRRIVCMFGGTFANLENEILFVRNSLLGFAPGDLLLINTSLTYASVDRPQEIVAKDPRLSGRLPLGWRQHYEEWLAGPIKRYGRDVAGVEFDSVLDTACCPIPGSYAVEIQATVQSEFSGERQFSVFRIKRHEVIRLVECLKQLGWDPVDGWRYGDDPVQSSPRLLYLFRRR